MKLLWIRLRNFKGFDKRVFIFDGKNASIYGDNGLGKTTIYDGMNFLFFGKDSLGQAKFQITPIGMAGNVLAPLECEVEACFENPITGGRTTLRRVFAEKWTKQRGRAVSEKTGYETFYWVDDVPVKEGEYKAKVAELAVKEDSFKLLTNPLYFNEVLTKDKRRSMLFEFCDVTDAQVFEAFPELAELPAILDGKKPDEFKASVMSRRKKINEEIERIPARVDEVQRSKPADVDTSKKSVYDTQLQALRKNRDTIGLEISRLETGGAIADVLTQISNVELQISEKKNVLVQARTSRLEAKQKERTPLLTEETRLKNQIDVNNTNIAIANGDKEFTAEAVIQLRAEYDELEAKEFDGCNCPFCAQVLPAEKLEEMRAAFNLDKSNKLASIAERGIANKDRVAKLEKEVVDLADQNVKNTENLVNTRKKIAELNQAILNIENEETTSPEIVKLQEDLQSLNDKLLSLREGNQDVLNKLKADKALVDTSIEDFEAKVATITQAENADKRLAELKAEESNLAKTFELYEQHLHLIETFIRKKASMLEDRINSRFKMVKFRLFREQLNGGVEEICEAEVDGVPYNSLNNARRIQAGLDIIDTFGDYYNFHPVVFVDGRESVVRLPEMKCQVISLVVSEKDQELRVDAQ